MVYIRGRNGPSVKPPSFFDTSQMILSLIPPFGLAQTRAPATGWLSRSFTYPTTLRDKAKRAWPNPGMIPQIKIESRSKQRNLFMSICSLSTYAEHGRGDYGQRGDQDQVEECYPSAGPTTCS